MSAFFVSRIRVKDPAKMKAYAEATGPTIAAHGGKVAVRGAFAKTLLGAAENDHLTSIVTFPDLAAVDTWFASPEYQQHSALREAAGDMQFAAYEAPSA